MTDHNPIVSEIPEHLANRFNPDLPKFWVEMQNVSYGTEPLPEQWERYEHYPSPQLREIAIRDHRRFHATFDLGTQTQTLFRPEPELPQNRTNNP